MEPAHGKLHGAGLGLRRALLGPLTEQRPDLDFLEVTPENWLAIGGALGKGFGHATDGYPLLAHGLSLNLGGPDPLDEGFILRLKGFLERFKVRVYSEHLSYCAAGGHLYDLMPIPFTEQAADYVATRIRRAQELLERPIAIENVSYYAAPARQMDEAQFINRVVAAADCQLLLDINNVYVNGWNHGYDPWDFICAMPAGRIAYLHVAGHLQQAPDLIIDTHGAAVDDPVWSLLANTYQRLGPLPTLLERDFKLPPLDELLGEVAQIRTLQHNHGGRYEQPHRTGT